MEDAVDEARRPERQDRQLEQPDQEAVRGAEHQQLDRQEEQRATKAVPGIQVLVHPVFLDADAIGFHQVGIARRLAVQERALAQDGPQAVDAWAVRVVLGIALGVVLAVHRDPGLGGDAVGGQPDPHAKQLAQGGMKCHGAVAARAVQIQLAGEDGHDVRPRHGQRDAHGAELDESFEHGILPVIVLITTMDVLILQRE